MEYFVDKRSVVREIWGKSDTILLIFAGAAAEFALNKAVDWLYFTGRLPADPIGRLFSTVSYARTIVFSEESAALRAIDAIAAIHSGVEAKRGTRIPDQAYRDVLFMLIDLSIRSFEVLERDLDRSEEREVFNVFNRMGTRMGVKDLPENFEAWQRVREAHMQENLQYSGFTKDLFAQYRKHLGWLRYRLLLESQLLIAPRRVRELLGFKRASLLQPLIVLYKLGRSFRFDRLMKELILPPKYKKEFASLDRAAI